MNVRLSTRATSRGSERHRKLRGRLAGFSRSIMPRSTIMEVSTSTSRSLPSHQWTRSAFTSAAKSATQLARPRFCVGAGLLSLIYWSSFAIPAL